MPVYVWESQTGTVTIAGTVNQGIVDNLINGQPCINITADGMLVNHDRVTVINTLQRLGYRLVGDTVHGVAAGGGWTVWTLESESMGAICMSIGVV